MAKKSWELANNVETVSSVDEIYRFDAKQQQDILTAKPWDREYVDYFLNTDLEIILLRGSPSMAPFYEVTFQRLVFFLIN